MNPMEHRAPHLRLRPRRATARGSIDLLLVMACAGVGLGMQAPWAPPSPKPVSDPGVDADAAPSSNLGPSLAFRDERIGAGVHATAGADRITPVNATTPRSATP